MSGLPNAVYGFSRMHTLLRLIDTHGWDVCGCGGSSSGEWFAEGRETSRAKRQQHMRNDARG